MEEGIRGQDGGREGEREAGSAGKGLREEVRAGGERFKWPSHTAVNLPKTSSASCQGLSARLRGGVQGRGRCGLRVRWSYVFSMRRAVGHDCTLKPYSCTQERQPTIYLKLRGTELACPVVIPGKALQARLASSLMCRRYPPCLGLASPAFL
ncbi:hypothetical protein E2C01_031998 [Portunus trituberculatus]|uniref:Uncharacterized protein n=1 Tax=Portunus trituberculatus TaxID=210409 RepID=A0A5B7EUX1_PORTR|nr:hypothetical protein [Portunus trituberculatus]